jgi:hypothetical protein
MGDFSKGGGKPNSRPESQHGPGCFEGTLSVILMQLQQLLLGQEHIKEQLMSVKTTVEQHAAQVNEFSNQLAAAIEGVRGDIADLKAQLVDASTPAEVDAILAPVLAKLKAQADAATALDAENQPSIPPVPPPVEPPL